MQPVVGAIACVWRKDAVLLVHRAKPPIRWAMPGGHVEAGEKLIEAANRECLEETGIKAELTHFVDVVEIIRSDVHFVIGCYAGFWLSGEPRAGDDASAADFFTIAKISTLDLVPNTQQLIEKAHKLLR